MISHIVWRTICALDEILPDTGVAALLADTQIAIFRIGEGAEMFALANRDPFSDANVLARGIVGDLGGQLVVASPIYKQHFRLTDGVCVEDETVRLTTYPIRVFNGAVQLGAEVASVASHGERPHLVMIGNGMAGMRVIEDLLRTAPDRYEITIFSAEDEGNYNRIMLSSLLAGELEASSIMLHAPQWYEEHGIRLVRGDPILAIDRVRREVHAASGEVARYDRLLIATGSNPLRLQIPGIELSGVLTFRDLKDVEIMRAACATGRHAVVVGGGLLGLEAAYGLQRNGMHVTVVHRREFLMEKQLDGYAGGLVQRSLERKGISFCLGAEVVGIDGDSHVERVKLDSGLTLNADLLVMAIGIVPNISLAKAARLHAARGIVVDDTLQTYDPRIYAVGECVEHRGMTYGLVAPLFEQARVCAAHLAGVGHLRYSGSALWTSLKVTGVDVFSAGETDAEGGEDMVLRDAGAEIYKRIVVRDGIIKHVLLIGDTGDGPWFHSLLRDRIDVRAYQKELLFGRAHVDMPVAA